MAEPQTGGPPRYRPALHFRQPLPHASKGIRASMIVGIDGTPAIRRFATGTEIYARSIIEALAASRGTRTMRVYANAIEAPPWLPAGAEWRGIPFPRVWTHWRLRQALRRERPDVNFIHTHDFTFALG